VADSSFEAFVREHSTSLLRTSYLLTGEVAAAEDLLQDAFVRLYPNWGRVTGARAPMAYVRRCLLNEYLNARRRGGVQIVDVDVAEDADPAPDLVDGVAARDETTRLLAVLSERQRAAVVLRYYHALDDTEIAETLGCRRATVRSLVSRALLAMRTAQAATVAPAGQNRTP
jgi:RNA polymerase sigma-70 factor (sigma-E family)